MEELLWNNKEGKKAFSVMLEGERSPLPLIYTVSISRIGKTAGFVIDVEALTASARGREPSLSTVEFIKRIDATAWFRDQEKQVPVDTVDLKGETLLSQISGLTPRSPEITECRQALSSWAIYDELRTDSESEIRRPTISRFETRLESDGQNLTAVLHTLYAGDKEFKEDLDSTMRAAFGEEYNGLVFPPVGSQHVQLCIDWKSLQRPQPSTSLSDGTLRFLQIITALMQPNPPTMIAIDEPEVGLHPSMMPLIAECAEDVALRSQIILTTHSDEFLSDFNREEPPTITVMELCNGESKMRILDHEHLRYWLEDYSLGELYRSWQLEQMEGIEAVTA
jgi:predicted ATPase